MEKDTRGYVVKLPDGRKGRTYHRDSLIKGKQPVYLEGEKPYQFDGGRVLKEPEQLTICGFAD